MTAEAATSRRDTTGGAFEPAYLRLVRSGELAERARAARAHLEDCDLCARYCRVDRRGSRGSGTIFFSWCNLRCVYCQNFEISWRGEGVEASDEELAGLMLRLQA